MSPPSLGENRRPGYNSPSGPRKAGRGARPAPPAGASDRRLRAGVRLRRPGPPAGHEKSSPAAVRPIRMTGGDASPAAPGACRDPPVFSGILSGFFGPRRTFTGPRADGRRRAPVESQPNLILMRPAVNIRGPPAPASRPPPRPSGGSSGPGRPGEKTGGRGRRKAGFPAGRASRPALRRSPFLARKARKKTGRISLPPARPLCRARSWIFRVEKKLSGENGSPSL